MLQPTLRVNEVGCKDGVDEGALPQPGLANDDYVELEAPLQELVFDLAGDGVETDVG